MSAATERERGRSFDVLGFLASDTLEAVESTLWSESRRWGSWSAASMTVVCAFRRKGACGRGRKAEEGELAVAAASTLDAGDLLPDGNRHLSHNRSRHPIHDVLPRRR